MAGWQPIYETIDLTKGYDWFFSRERKEGAIPTDTVIEIRWATGQVWPASISGATASWRIESEVADLIAADTEYTTAVRYPNGNTSTFDDYAWKIGHCRRIQNKT